MSPMCWFQGDLIQTAERKTAMLTTLPFPALEHLEPSRLWSGGGASRTGAICCCLWCHGAFPSNGYDIVTFCWFLSQRYITDADETQCVSILHFFRNVRCYTKSWAWPFSIFDRRIWCVHFVQLVFVSPKGLEFDSGLVIRRWAAIATHQSSAWGVALTCSDMLWSSWWHTTDLPWYVGAFEIPFLRLKQLLHIITHRNWLLRVVAFCQSMHSRWLGDRCKIGEHCWVLRWGWKWSSAIRDCVKWCEGPPLHLSRTPAMATYWNARLKYANKHEQWHPRSKWTDMAMSERHVSRVVRSCEVNMT